MLSGDQAHRLAAVVRLREGDELRLFCGDGREWSATVAAAGKSQVHVRVVAVTRQEPLSPLALEAWCPLVRPARFEWAIEKCTEAGADVIRPLLSSRSARGEGSAAKQERWGRIAIEAAEQCGRLHVPVIEAPATLDALLARHHGAILAGAFEGRPWPEAVRLLPPSGRLAIAIGPEGGFEPAELDRLRAAGAILARFGPNTLRAETAAVAACILVRAHVP